MQSQGSQDVSIPSSNMKVSGHSLTQLLSKKKVDDSKTDVVQLLNDYDLDAGEILSWLRGTSDSDVLIPKHERESKQADVCLLLPFSPHTLDSNG